MTGRSANRGVVPAVARHHSGCSPGFVPCRSRESLARTAAPWARSRSGSQIWKKLPRPTKAASVEIPVCSRMKSVTVIRPSWSYFRNVPSPWTKNDMSSAVCRNGILQRDPLLVAVEQVEPADIQRRHVELADGIEFRIAALLHHRAEMRRHGNPPLRVDPVDCTGQKPVHHSIQKLPPPRPVSPLCPRLRSAAPAANSSRFSGRAKPRRTAPPLPVSRTPHAHLERNLDYRNGISWGNMGVNGNRHSNQAKTAREGRIVGIPLFIVH